MKLERIVYRWTLPSERKPDERAAILRLRYSDGSYEDVELLPGESLDVDELPVIHMQVVGVEERG